MEVAALVEGTCPSCLHSIGQNVCGLPACGGQECREGSREHPGLARCQAHLCHHRPRMPEVS